MHEMCSIHKFHEYCFVLWTVEDTTINFFIYKINTLNLCFPYLFPRSSKFFQECD